MSYLPCTCGHDRCWHVTDEPPDGFTGHYCEYPNCDCWDYTPDVDFLEDA